MRVTECPDSGSLLMQVKKIFFPSEDAPVMVCCFGQGKHKHTTENICEDICPPLALTSP